MDIALRATAIFAFLFVLLRLLGKRELGQMTPFELVVVVVLGDFVQQAVTQADTSITAAVIAVSTFAFWALVLSWGTYLSPQLEALLDGRPRVLVRNGEILHESLRRDRMTRGEVESEMRIAGIASIRDVAWAILEPQGKISFIARDKDDRL